MANNLIRVKQINQSELSGSVQNVIASNQFQLNYGGTGININNIGQITISGTDVYLIDSNFNVSGTGIFNALDLNNIDNLALSGVDITITSGNIVSTNSIIAPNIVYNTGNQTISGNKSFVNGISFSQNHKIYLDDDNSLIISGSDNTPEGMKFVLANNTNKTSITFDPDDHGLVFQGDSYYFLNQRPTVNNTGVLLSGESPAISSSLVTHIRPSGTNNVFVSSAALASTSSDSNNNTAVGANALTVNNIGDNNVAIGTNALSSNTNGNGNVAVGMEALKNANGPDANIGIGTQAGDTIQAGGSNIIIGHEADVDNSGRQRCIVLGRSAVSPAVDGSLAIGGDGGNIMNGLTTATAGAGATSYMRIWLNGLEYRILIQRAS